MTVVISKITKLKLLVTIIIFKVNKSQNNQNTIRVTKLNKFLLNEDTSKKVCSTTLEKLQIKSAAIF